MWLIVIKWFDIRCISLVKGGTSSLNKMVLNDAHNTYIYKKAQISLRHKTRTKHEIRTTQNSAHEI